MLGKEVQVGVTFFCSRIDSPILTGCKKWGGVRSVFHFPWSRLFHLSDVDVIWNQQAACLRWPCKIPSCSSMFLLSKEPFQPGLKSAQLSHIAARLKREYPVPEHLKDFVNEVTDATRTVSLRRFVNVAFVGSSGKGRGSWREHAIMHHYVPMQSTPCLFKGFILGYFLGTG